MSSFAKDFSKAMSQAGTSPFQEAIRQELEYSMKMELDKILGTAPQNELQHTKKDLEGFQKLFHRFLQEKGPSVDWGKIQRPPEDSIQPYEKIKARGIPDSIASVLNKLVVVKLNGGLGTSMGCKGPKSLIGVRNENTFLDLTVQQIEHLNKTYNTDVPLVLMNSFNTDEDTKKILQKYSHSGVKIHTFNQSRYPRINKESLLPVAKDVSYSGENTEAWYPPGHGDIYASFYNSGLLDIFIEDGKEYIFVSNIDNLGATVDLYILNHLMNSPNGKRCEFVMEVTNKTRADVKGGTLTQYENKLRLVEIAQVPKAHVDEFKSVSKFKIFNTNNLWISLSAIKRLQEQNAIDMEIIVNPKTLDGGLNVIQLETAVGAAIKSFENSLGINVPRSRFLPVKTTSDLLLVMSNLYSLNAGSLTMSEKREFPSVPLVKLGSSFTKVQDFLRRFESIPDMLELDHLTVSGDVTFGKHVALMEGGSRSDQGKMRFRFCGDLDCPDWVLAEISTLAKISSVKLKLICAQVLKDVLGEGIDYDKILKLTSDAKFESGDVKATVAVLAFILSSAAKYNVDSESLSSELQQLGLPKEHAAGLCRSYEEKQSSLQDSLRKGSLRLNCLDSVSWRVDYTLSSSELQQVNEPIVHLKLNVKNVDQKVTEPVAMTLSAEKFRVLLAELKQAQAIMKTLE